MAFPLPWTPQQTQAALVGEECLHQHTDSGDIRMIYPQAPSTLQGENDDGEICHKNSDNPDASNSSRRLLMGAVIPYLRYVFTHSGLTLDNQYRHLQTSLYREDPFKIFLSKWPFTTSYTLTWSRLLITVVITFTLLMESGLRTGSLQSPINAFNEVSIHRGRFIRFTTFRVRDRDISNILSAGISAFGIMRNGCSLSLYSGSPGEEVHADSENIMYSHNVSNTNTSIALHFKDVVKFDGWFLVTAQETPSLDPAVFEVETSDDGETWRRVASSLRADKCGAVTDVSMQAALQSPLLSENSMELVRQRGAKMEFHFMSWHCIMPVTLLYGANLALCLAWFTSVLLAVYVSSSWLRWQPAMGLRFPVQFLGTCSVVCSLVRIVALIMMLAEDTLHLLPYPTYSHFTPGCVLTESLVLMLLWPGPDIFLEVFWQERFSLASLILNAVGSSGCSYPVEYAAMVVTATLLLVFREVRRYQVLQSVTGDMETFVDIWHSCIDSDPHFAPAVADLKSLQLTVDSCLLEMGSGSPDYRDTRRHAEILSCACFDAPVTSLDQLYAQAVILEPIFRSKVENIAHKCNAEVFVDQRADEASSSRDHDARVQVRSDIKKDDRDLLILSAGAQWAGLKTVDRTMNKLAVVHGGDMSKLTDLVRQRIVCKSLAHIYTCLQSITHDPDLETVGIQNGFDPTLDGIETAGYRHLVVKLKITTKASILFSVSQHVCELQLCHASMLQALTPEREKRLLAYQDMFQTLGRGWWPKPASLRKTRDPFFHSNIVPSLVIASAHSSLDPHSSWHSAQADTGSTLTCSSSKFPLNSIVPLDGSEMQASEPRHLSQPEQFAFCNTAVAASDRCSDFQRSDILAQFLQEDGVDPSFRIEKRLPDHQSDDPSPLSRPVNGNGQVQLPHHVRDRIYQLMILHCRYPSGILNCKLQTWKNALEHVDAAMILFTRPIGSFTKKPMQLATLIASAYMFYTFVDGVFLPLHSNPSNNVGRNVYQLRHVRLTVLETRVPLSLVTGSAVGISSLDLMLNGCKIDRKHSVVSSNATVLFLSFPRQVQANGFMMTTSRIEGTEDRAPMRFLIHVSLPNASNKTLAELIVANKWLNNTGGKDTGITSGASVWTKTRDELRAIILRNLQQAGRAWCADKSCESMTDSELVASYFPPHLLAENQWMLMSASVCRWTTPDKYMWTSSSGSRTCFPLPLQQFDLGTGRGKTSVFDLRAPWFFLAANYVQCLFWGIGLVLIAIFGFLGNVGACQCIVSFVCFTVPGLIAIITAFLFATSPSILTGPEDSFFWWLHGATYIFNAIVTAFFENYCMITPLVAWVVNSAALTIHDDMLKEGANVPSQWLTAGPIVLHSGSTMFMVLWIIFYVIRHYHLFCCRKKLDTDRAEYDRLWDTAFSNETHAQQLTVLKEAANDLAPVVPSLPWVGFKWAGEERRADESTHGRHQVSKQQVQNCISLEQLYTQALVLEPLFLDKVIQIASVSNGYLVEKLPKSDSAVTLLSSLWTKLCLPCPFLSLFEQGRGEEGNAHNRVTQHDRVSFVSAVHYSAVDKTNLKTVDRSVEKIVRSYKDNIVLLCDVVRETVVFESVGDMVLMMRALGQDPEIKVVLIKNRMVASHDSISMASGGYRDVLIRLCVQNEVTMDLGISNHVCELQFLLKEFYMYKSKGGHEHYVACRNMRCA